MITSLAVSLVMTNSGMSPVGVGSNHRVSGAMVRLFCAFAKNAMPKNARQRPYTPEPVYLDIEEKGSLVCDLYPNPTNKQFTISGTDLKQAKVINTLGQCVAIAKGEGERLTVDISNLPAGVYFVNITDSEGRKCVKKVVKK